MSLDIPIRVGYQSIKDAAAETQKLKQKLVDVGSMNVDVHTRMEATHSGSQAVFMQQNRAIQSSIDKLIRGGQSGSWATNPDGSRTYTSPTGVKYGGGTPPPSASDGGGFSLGDMAKKFIAPAVIGYAIWNELKADHRSAKTFEQGRLPLALKGVNIKDDVLSGAANIGTSSSELIQAYEAMSGSGISNRQMGSFAAKYMSPKDGKEGYSANYGNTIVGMGLSTGLGTPTFANYLARTTKVSDDKADKAYEHMNAAASNLLKSSQKLGIWGRLGETYQAHNTIMEQFAMSRGGQVASGKDLDNMTSLQTAMMGLGKIGQGQQGANLWSGLNSGILGGGSDPGSKILFARALGIDKVHDQKSLWEYKTRKSQGATPENILATLQELDRVNPGDQWTKKNALLEMFPALKPQQINALTATSKGGFSFQSMMAKVTDGHKVSAKDLQSSDAYHSALEEFGLTDEQAKEILGLQDKSSDTKNEALGITGAGRSALKATIIGKNTKNSIKAITLKGLGAQTTSELTNKFGDKPLDLNQWGTDDLKELQAYYNVKGTGNHKIRQAISGIMRNRFTEGVDTSHYPRGGEISQNNNGETFTHFVGDLGNKFDKFLAGLHAWTQTMYQQKQLEREKGAN